MNTRELLQSLHRKGTRAYYEALVCAVLFLGLTAASVIAWQSRFWPITILCWILQAHVGHANLVAFHEAAHFLLHPNRKLNESQGMLIGSTILTPLSAYRWLHHYHHNHLGSERDLELWPYVDPTIPRFWRRLAAVCELTLGFFYTPLLLLRGILVSKGVPRHVKRRIIAEYVLCVALWGTILGLVGYFGARVQFVVGYLVPSMIAGNLQSLRKFIEHMGLLGHDVASSTRTVVDTSRLGRLLSASLMHVDLHGPHHRYGKIPHYRLPQATPLVYERELSSGQEANVHRSYLSALRAVVRTLGDPRVGAQWLRTAPAPASKSD